jgi:hypothetical protein
MRPVNIIFFIFLLFWWGEVSPLAFYVGVFGNVPITIGTLSHPRNAPATEHKTYRKYTSPACLSKESKNECSIEAIQEEGQKTVN